MRISRALVRMLTAGLLVVLSGAVTAQQAFPNKPIRFIVPYTPGSTPDTLVRLVGPKMTESWGQPVLVDHRPGGNAIIGSEALVRLQPDGTRLRRW